ncbi:MAG: sulfite exporter TauE/SafE family protein [Burkholderiales bacterium]|nr:sulfite exporter TauE/SafE family protein [Burkholderiales bacterium]
MSDPFTAGNLLCALAVLVGACVQGTSGIGFALFAAPLVALIQPALVPGPMLVLGGVVSMLAALREWRLIDLRAASIAFAGRVPGSLAAGLAIGAFAHKTFATLFALMILAAVALSLVAGRVEARPLMLGGAGFASGFMGTITSVGTPPMGLVLQSADPGRLRATIGVFLVAGAVVSLSVLAAAGRFHWSDLMRSLMLLPALGLGFMLSTPLRGRFSQAAMRKAVLTISTLAALLLLWRSG